MTARKPVRCRHSAGDSRHSAGDSRHSAGDTWTSTSACAWAKRVRQAGGNSWGRRAVRGCHAA